MVDADVGVVVGRGDVVLREGGAVVAGEDDEGFVGDALLLEEVEDLLRPLVVVALGVDVVRQLVEAVGQRDVLGLIWEDKWVVGCARYVREEDALIVVLGGLEGITDIIHQRLLLETEVVGVWVGDTSVGGGLGAEVLGVNGVLLGEANLGHQLVELVELERGGLVKVRLPLGLGIRVLGIIRQLEAVHGLKDVRQAGLVDVVLVVEVEIGNQRRNSAQGRGQTLEGVGAGRDRLGEVKTASSLLRSLGVVEAVVKVSGDEVGGWRQRGELVLHMLGQLLVRPGVGQSVPDQAILLNREYVVPGALQKEDNDVADIDIFELVLKLGKERLVQVVNLHGVGGGAVMIQVLVPILESNRRFALGEPRQGNGFGERRDVVPFVLDPGAIMGLELLESGRRRREVNEGEQSSGPREESQRAVDRSEDARDDEADQEDRGEDVHDNLANELDGGG